MIATSQDRVDRFELTLLPSDQAKVRHSGAGDAVLAPAMDRRKRCIHHPGDSGGASEKVDYLVGHGLHERYLRQSQTLCKRKSAIMAVANIADRRFKGGMTPHEIRAELDARGMSIRDLAEATGINENYLTKSLGKAGRKIQHQEMVAIEKILLDSDDSQERIRTIPLLGEVPAGKFEPHEQRGGRRLAVSDPETPPRAYALTVKGDSMDLVVPNGATLVIDPDDVALWPGRRYVVQTEDGQTTFKEFQADPARLVPCSSNDEHKEIMLGSEPIRVVGRVFSYSMRDVPRRSS